MYLLACQESYRRAIQVFVVFMWPLPSDNWTPLFLFLFCFLKEKKKKKKKKKKEEEEKKRKNEEEEEEEEKVAKRMVALSCTE